jgi:glycosyltransferase involved in cell wall biosynthesis
MTKSNNKISFLVPDIGAPTIGAALKLARAIEPEFQTEIIGPDFGAGICSLYRDAYPFTSVPAGRLYRLPDYFRERKRLEAAISGDIVVCVKAFASNLPVALRYAGKKGKKVVVYLDEWDGALWAQKSFAEKVACVAKHAQHPMEDCYLPITERLIRHADTVWSTTTFLQKRFGGHVVYAGVDTDRFRPQPADRVREIRSRYELNHARVIVFGGVVRPHKGVEEILDALVRLANPNFKLFIPGPITDHLEHLLGIKNFAKHLVVAGTPIHDASGLNAYVHENMPLYLDAGDLVVLPARNTLLAKSQMPIKIFEAMAMAKPIIVTDVGDLPMIIQGCGRVVPPGRVEPLAEAIDHVLSHPKDAEAMGQVARERCIQLYSKSVTEKNLFYIIDAIHGQRMPL